MSDEVTKNIMEEDAESITEATIMDPRVPSEVTFSIPDYVVFLLMLVVSMGIGVVSGVKGRRSASAGDYLLGGRTISPFAVALSLLGGSVSAITLLGNATEVYFFGTQFCTSLLGMVVGGLVVYHVILPILYDLRLVSMSQYLEMRFKSLWVRQAGSICQVLCMVLLMPIILYAPSLALVTVTGLSTWASVIIMGGICTIYTTIGGVRGVVYTDVLQTTIMYLGVVLVLVYGGLEVGGLANVWDIASQGSRIQFFEMDPSPFLRHSFWSTSVIGFYLILYFYGINQAAHQRFCSVSSLTVAKRLCIVAVGGCILLYMLCFLAGLTAYAVYSGCDPLVSGRIIKPDQILPYMVADKLGHLTGIPGLFVAAVYGAVLSSVSSIGNSLACLVWDDFLRHHHYFKSLTNRGATNTLRALAFASGVIGLLLALVVGRLGNILQMAISVVGAVNGPLTGLYLTGMCTPWVGHKGAGVGFLTAFILNIWYLVGNIMRGKASPTPLPMSTQACPVNLTTTTTTPATFITTTTMMVEATQDAPSRTLYDFSYCYSGVGGIIVTICISSLASLCTGMLNPWEMENGVAHPLGVRLHCFLWRLFKKHKSVGQLVKVKEAAEEDQNA